MRVVIVGRQRRGEQVAGAVAHGVQETGGRIVSPPVARHGDAATVGQAEGGDVDRIGGGMLAPRASLAAVEAPTAVAADMINRRDRTAQDCAGGGLHHVPLPHRQRRGDRAGDAETGRRVRDAARSARDEADAVGIAAAALPGPGRQHGVVDAGSRQCGAAGGEIIGQRGQLAPGEQPRRLPQVERRPGQVLRPSAQARSCDEQQRHDHAADDEQPGDPPDRPHQPRIAVPIGSAVKG